ncbi:MAG: NAD(P)/FAD-dependent oxidoreductase [Desulfobacterales bacterium]|jgi:phytoene dehydrogenase-like protein|nr:NAD(P)/FAD-dependent oxidoreductase [Desulfobacterales bacterium]
MKSTDYDAIIIGAGHNGMALSTYLGKSGWRVLVLERRQEEGGGLSTECYTLPGHLHNLHSNYHTFVGLCPVYDDLGLIGDDGVTYAHPAVQMGSIFEDGTAITIHTDMAKTHASMSRFSTKDADTFMRLYKEVKGFQDLMIQALMYAPPIHVNDITRALTSFGVEEKTEFFRAKLRSMTVHDFLNKHFENEKIKVMLAFHAAVCGYCTDTVGLAVSFPFMLGKIDNWRLALGGSHRLAHALWRQMRRAGVTLLPAAPVQQILLEDGRAVGVRLEDGTEFHASKLVASSIDLDQTFNKMLPAGAVPDDIHKVVDGYKYQDASTYTVHLAMRKIPTYKAAQFDPDINKAWVLNIGYNTLEDYSRDWADIRNKRVPEPKLNVAVNSLYDPYDAPEGAATGMLRLFAPYEIGDKGSGGWDANNFKKVYMQRCISKWQQYCEDFTDADILMAKPYTPYDISAKLINMVNGDWMVGKIADDNLLAQRPASMLSQYRTPVKGLYLCGSCTHPHGFITFGPGYNALSVIADDFGLEKWWAEV